MTELTPQQKLSLATDKNIAVTAGAGTGKTRILVERFVHILLTEEVDIKEILAITFTEKAAAEMMERVSLRIDKLLDSETDNVDKPRLFQLKNRLNSAHISTIHAFCSRLLRENPIEAGVDPDFKVMNDFQSTLLQNESITEVLDFVNQNKEEWIEFFRFFGLYNIKNMLVFSLDHRYELQKYQNENSELNPNDKYEKIVESFLRLVSDVFDDEYMGKINSIVQSVPQNDFPQARQHNKGANAVDAIEQYLQTNLDQKSTEFWKALFILAKVFTTNEGRPYSNVSQLGTKKNWSEQGAQVLVELSEQLVIVANWIAENPATPPGEIDKLVLTQMPAYHKLYQLVMHIYTRKKSDISSLDFEDMQLLALNLLQNNPEIREKVARQFKYIMVDEFQDTNLLQWEIISKLGEINENKFFIVGDPKQSIYGFRNADVRVFNEVKKQFDESSNSAESGNITLTDSFRFKENVNAFINDTFTSVLTQSQNNPWEVDYDSLTSLRTDKSGGQVELAFLTEDESGDQQSEFIARRIVQIVSQTEYKFGDIAILLRTRNHLNEIEEQLRKSEIPFKTIGGIGFYQRQEIYDIYDLIRFLVNPHDDLALIGVLRSPFANISDEGLFYLAMERNKKSYWNILKSIENLHNFPQNDLSRLILFRKNADRWIQRRDRIDLSELLEEIVYECSYQVSMLVDFNGEQLFANLKKIIRIAEENEKSGYTSLIDFAESIKRLINSTTKEGEAQTDLEDETTVKVMTVHQAKGLEFPVVFHPYLEQKQNAFPDNSYFDEELGLVSNINLFGSQNKSFYLLELLKHKQQQKEIAELKRLFYVACSRAKNFLVLTSAFEDGKVPNNTPLEWLINSLEITNEQIIDGTITNSDTNIYKILLELPESERTGKGTQNHSHSSIKILKESKEKVSPELPLYLKEIKDQPQREMFSATQLMTFINDKKSYLNRYHLGFFEEDYDRQITSETDQDLATLKGKIFHRYLELYPETDIDSLLFDFEILNPDFVQELKIELKIFENRIQQSTYLSEVLQAAEFKNEVAITLKLGDSFLTGTIDRMYKNSNDLWEVVDYKTNKIESNQIELTAEKYKTQIEVYALLLSAIFPEQEKYDITLYFVQPDDKYRKSFTKKDLNEIESKLLSIVKEIKQYYPYTDASLLD